MFEVITAISLFCSTNNYNVPDKRACLARLYSCYDKNRGSYAVNLKVHDCIMKEIKP